MLVKVLLRLKAKRKESTRNVFLLIERKLAKLNNSIFITMRFFVVEKKKKISRKHCRLPIVLFHSI